jgi:hypothetical protein
MPGKKDVTVAQSVAHERSCNDHRGCDVRSEFAGRVIEFSIELRLEFSGGNASQLFTFRPNCYELRESDLGQPR